MSLITNILVPLDFSAPSRDALRYACDLADSVGASLHVLHAVQTPLMPGGSIELPLPDPWLIEELEEEGRTLLDGSLTDAQKQTYRAVLVQRSGDAAHEILDYVRERGDIDLIVMSTHGRGGISRFMMGSVADHVIREAPCPVLTLRTPAVAGRRAA